jgi:hypothetical protein
MGRAARVTSRRAGATIQGRSPGWGIAYHSGMNESDVLSALTVTADQGLPLVLADPRGPIAYEFARIGSVVRRWLRERDGAIAPVDRSPDQP